MKSYNPKEIETSVFKYWKDRKIYEKCKQKNKGKKKFYFLDGPPYTSGHIHIGTAWNKVLKDVVLRYKRMSNFDVWDRAGYDMHGLPIENRVMDQLGFKTKDDIEKYGVEKFIKECKKFALNAMKDMSKEFKELAVWMDFDNAYMPITKGFISNVWFLIKKAHEKSRLYKGKKTMHWCPKCATALAKHELVYKKVKETSIFVKFKVRKKENEYLIIWTTTPWTIPFNLGIMVHPEIEYAKIKVDNEYWIIAKNLANLLLGVIGKRFEIVESFIGKDLDGLEYEHPFYNELKNIFDELKQKNKRVHTVVLSSEYVDLSSGSGLVHMAPGCGPEDYEVGRRYNIPPFNNLDEYGVFPKEMNKFSGWIAKKDDTKFIEELEKKNAIIHKSEIEHEYPHCWRCDSPVIFRTTEQWFFKIEDIKQKMREFNKKIYWVPKWGGERWFDSWLENLKDNSITRQRYWGTPVPIWVCEKCKNYIVIGSVEELKKYADVPEDLHKPWIDDVTIKCEKCNGIMKRIPDVLDVWVDSGTTSWNCLDYPTRKDLFDKLFPADFILEGKDQIRGWFNLLMICSTIAFDMPAFKSVYMHGFVQDASGEKMSKSKGNVIAPKEIIDKYGVDAFRFYSVGGTNPGVDLNYSLKETENKKRSLNVLWNIHKYLIELCKLNDINPNDLNINELNLKVEDKYMLSKVNSTLREVRQLYEEYRINEIPHKIEELFLELSRTYIKFIRDRANDKKEAKSIIYTIFHSLYTILKMSAPIIPLICEKIYLNLKESFNLELESIHLHEFPKEDIRLIDKNLEDNMSLCKSIISAILSIRDYVNIGIRWPLRKATIFLNEDLLKKLNNQLLDLISKQTNIKELYLENYNEHSEILENEIKVENNNAIIRIKEGKIVLDLNMSKELISEGFSRETIRRLQQSRKELKLNKNDRIIAKIICDEELKEFIKEHITEIKLKTGCIDLDLINKKENEKYDFVKEYKIKNKKVIIMISKV